MGIIHMPMAALMNSCSALRQAQGERVRYNVRRFFLFQRSPSTLFSTELSKLGVGFRASIKLCALCTLKGINVSAPFALKEKTEKE